MDDAKTIIFDESDEWRGYWDTSVLVCAIFNAMAIPLTLSFYPSWAYDSIYPWADNMTNIVFFLDILVIFNTAILSKDKERINDRRRIAKKYIRGMFFIDLVSSLPWNLMIRNIQNIKLLNMIKMIRIARIHKVISRMKIQPVDKAVSNQHFIRNSNLEFPYSEAGFHAVTFPASVCMPLVRSHHLRLIGISRPFHLHIGLLLRWHQEDDALI